MPMTSVAGDFYDYIVADDYQAGLLIADVSGHGVPAALLTRGRAGAGQNQPRRQWGWGGVAEFFPKGYPVKRGASRASWECPSASKWLDVRKGSFDCVVARSAVNKFAQDDNRQAARWRRDNLAGTKGGRTPTLLQQH